MRSTEIELATPASDIPELQGDSLRHSLRPVWNATGIFGGAESDRSDQYAPPRRRRRVVRKALDRPIAVGCRVEGVKGTSDAAGSEASVRSRCPRFRLGQDG